ncbi:hypothetical protein CRM22_008405 [Opisthorchis felineus]|uniref:Uncharacterized protein n=1 Tax=Opisthorchis felineus TaxID=147828 RepID=A0A4S2LC07_OPIFE|nr:hypothetical protein CRM22_008405 [Opisthorchis felineus]
MHGILSLCVTVFCCFSIGDCGKSQTELRRTSLGLRKSDALPKDSGFGGKNRRTLKERLHTPLDFYVSDDPLQSYLSRLSS